MAKKKKKNSTPKRWRLTREARFKKAKIWIPTCTNKNIVKGYRNFFKVDIRCAIHELKILGISISSDYEEAVNRSVSSQRNNKKSRKKQDLVVDDFSDENFAFIAGYTSGGFPFGITWEQYELSQHDEDEDQI